MADTTVEADRALREHQQLVVSALCWRTCLNCENFVERTTVRSLIPAIAKDLTTVEQVCQLAGALPPPRVIVHGCPSWVARIPF